MKRHVHAFVTALLLVVSAVLPVAAHDGEHHGKEEQGWPGSARAQDVARAQLADSQPAQDLAAQSAVACDGGEAGGYPCHNVTLQAFLPLAEIGGGKANDVWGWTDPQTGREYALLGRTNGTSFVDITDPTAPVYLGNLPTTRFASTWRDLEVFNDHVFIVSESRNHGMQVFDLTRLRDVTGAPVTFSVTAHYAGFSTAHTIAINARTGFAYAAGSDTCSGGLHIVDLNTPTAPRQAGCFSADGYTHDVQCVVSTSDAYPGRELCFASNEDTLTVVDVSSKSAPVQLARKSYTGAAYTHQGWLTEDQAYFLIDDELDEGQGKNTRTYVFDVRDPSKPVHIGTHVGTNTAIDHNQFIVGRHTYQANYRSGLRVLDISGVGDVDATGTAQPRFSEVAFFDIYPADDLPEFNGAWSTYPFFSSGNVLVAGIEQGLFVLRPHLGSAPSGPSVSLDQPADGDKVAGSVTLAASASSDVEQVEFLLDETTSIGVDATAADGWSLVWDTTVDVSEGAHVLTARATAGGQSANDSVSVTVDNVPDPATVHVEDLSGTSAGRGGSWKATVTILVHDSSATPVEGATAYGDWSHGDLAGGSCVTGADGRCSIVSGSIPKKQATVTFKVTDIGHSLPYDPTVNAETSILIAKP